VKVLGYQTKTRINTAVTDIYKNSVGKSEVSMSEEVMEATNTLRKFMFERVYELANVSIQERSERMLTQMFEYFIKHVDKLPKGYLRLLDKDGTERVVCDYLSGMTDRYAIGVFENLFIPTTFSIGGIHT
jgi:dGTPase